MIQVAIPDISSDRDGFLRLHQEKIGASEVAIVCGLSPYKTPFQLWCEKTGKIKKQDSDNDFTWLGTKMEGVIAELFERRTGLALLPANHCITNEAYPFMVASPDRYVVDADGVKGNVEIKNTSFYQKSYWGERQAPDAAHCQALAACGVAGLETFYYIAGLVGGSPKDFYYPRFEFDRALFDSLMSKCAEFAELVKKDIPPPVGGSDTKAIQEYMGEPDPDKKTTLPEGAREHLRVYDKLMEEKKTLEIKVELIKERVEAIKNSLRLSMGHAQFGQLDDRLVVVKEWKRKAYSVPENSGWSVIIK